MPQRVVCSGKKGELRTWEREIAMGPGCLPGRDMQSALPQQSARACSSETADRGRSGRCRMAGLRLAGGMGRERVSTRTWGA